MRSILWVGLAVAVAIGGALFSKTSKPHKKKYAQCVSDNGVFPAFCLKASQDDETFKRFKQSPAYALLQEQNSFEEGEEYLRLIESRYPELIQRLDSFRSNDAIGSPKLFEYGLRGLFSPSTLRFAKTAGDIKAAFGDLDGCTVVEIGGGCGGQCKILSDLFAFESYTIIDLPECLELARRCLQEQGIENVKFLKMDEITETDRYDLVISNYAFTESDRSIQKNYLDKIIRHAQWGYLACNVVPRHFRVNPFSKEELITKLKRHELSLQFLQEEPRTGKDNYIVIWNNGKR